MKIQKLAIKFIVMSLTVFAAFGVFAGNVSAAEINGYYEGDDGGAYFIRQIGNKIYWFGEDPKGGFANVLAGTISGNKLTASFWDVPKGKSKGAGEITLEIQAGGATLVKLSSTVPFGMKTLKKFVMKTELVGGVPVIKNLPPEMRSRPEGFSGGEGNLTGAWTTDDLSTYYVREMPNGDVVWFAENNAWGGPGGYAQPTYAQVFIGKNYGKTILGEWVDVPKGKAAAKGPMTLGIKNRQELDVVAPWKGFSPTKFWRSLPNSLRGFADLHSHPMVNLALGGKFVHGGVDVGSLLPADSDCKPRVLAKSIAHALGNDKSTHGGWGLGSNECGDFLRQAIIDNYQEMTGSVVTPDNAVGYPSFKDYPKWNDTTHQKMWVDWVRRSYDGGQRVLVALAMNNQTLASGVSGPGDGPTDDKASADLQIKEMKAFVGRHNDFMEIAYTPADLRRIVAANKMAIILGVEIDNIGNFHQVEVTDAMLSAEIERLYTKMGVRYIFPVHLIDNKFGGTAYYKDIFNLSNYHVTGKFWNLQCSEEGEGITKKFKVDGFDFMLAGAKATKLQVDIARFPAEPPNPNTDKNCPAQYGHKNKLPLTNLGERAVREMMRRGMLIDVDHMSLGAVDETIRLAEEVPGKYPLVSGHNSLRSVEKNENSRSDEQLKKIDMLGGMFGLGSSGVKAGNYVKYYDYASKFVGAGRIAFGTDLNGLEKGPPPPLTSDINNPVKFGQELKVCSDELYGGIFVKSKTGDKTWDYCANGVAHYGMLPDFLRDLGNKPKGDVLNTNILKNAEMFAQMWEKAVKNGKGA